MAQYERPKKENEVDKPQRKKKPEQSPGSIAATDTGTASALCRSIDPSIDEHARLFADAGSDRQRTQIALELQQNFGNTYAQQVLEHSKKSIKPSAHPSQTGSVNLQRTNNNTSLAVNFKTVIKSQEGLEEDVQAINETIAPQQQTAVLPGSSDSISPAYIGLSQQTSVGGSAMRSEDHGSYTPIFTKDVVVTDKGGFFSKTWEVSASLIVNYHWSIQSLGKKDILNAYSDGVNPTSWPDIVTDLRPMGGGVPRSPRYNYWCSDLSAEHEMYHINDCTQAFKSFLPEQETWLAQQTPPGNVTAKSLGFQAIDQLIAKVHNYMGEGASAPQEERAYSVGAADYEARAQDVYDRAYVEGWMDDDQTNEYEEDQLEPEEVEPEEDEDEGDSWWNDLWPDENEPEEEEPEEEEPEEEEPQEEEPYGYGEEPDGEEEEEEDGGYEGGYQEEDGGYEGGYSEESYEEEDESYGYSNGYGEESYEEEYY
jgi:hypothetical protein